MKYKKIGNSGLITSNLTLGTMLSLLSTCSNEMPEPFDLVITNVNLIDGTGSPLQSEVNVYIKDGRIQAINKNNLQQTANLIDGSGKYLMPGLFDCHVHTTSFNEAFPKFMFIYFAIGIIGFFISSFGIARMMMGEHSLLIWAFPVALLLMLSAYATGKFGERLGSEQVDSLKQFIREAMDNKITELN